MQLSVEEEDRYPRSGHSLDLVVHHTPVLGQTDADTTVGCGGGWVVEFEGSSHFLVCGAPTGAALIKRHHLRLLGHTLVSIPYWEWDSMGARADDQDKYLWGKLQSSTATDFNTPLSPPTGGGERIVFSTQGSMMFPH